MDTLGVAAGSLQQDIERMMGRQRPGHALHALDGEAVVGVPHHLEGGQFAAEMLSRHPQESRDLPKRGQGAQRHLPLRRRGKDAQRCARHHAEDALAADEKLLQVDAGIVLDVFAQALEHGAIGRDDFEAEDQVSRHAVTDDAVAAGIGRDVAADGAAAARTKVERKHQAVLLDPFLELLQWRAGLRDGDAGGGIDLFNAVHALHRQHDFVRIRQRAAHQPGHAALRRNGDTLAMTQPQQGGDILRRPRADDRARFRCRVAGEIVMIARVDVAA